MVAMTEMAVPSQQQQQSTTTKTKAKEKKSAAAAAAASSAAAAAGQSHASGTAAKAKNVVERRPAPSPPPPASPQDPLELEMARKDLLRVAHPDTHTPFTSLEDACERLLPYHVLAEYEFEDDYEEGTSEPLSKAQAWEETLKTKAREFVTTLEKQVILYNSIMMKQRQGDMRGEERMMVEQSLLLEERQKLSNVRAQIEAKEKEEREEAEAKAKKALALAERARAEEQARAEAEAQARAEAEAESKAETLRAAEVDSLAQAESEARIEGTSSAVPSEPAPMTGGPGTSAHGSFEELEDDADDADEDPDDDQEDDEESEGGWDDDVHDEDVVDDEGDSSEDLGTTKMSTDHENRISSPNTLPKPS